MPHEIFKLGAMSSVPLSLVYIRWRDQTVKVRLTPPLLQDGATNALCAPAEDATKWEISTLSLTGKILGYEFAPRERILFYIMTYCHDINKNLLKYLSSFLLVFCWFVGVVCLYLNFLKDPVISVIFQFMVHTQCSIQYLKVVKHYVETRIDFCHSEKKHTVIFV